MMIIINVQVEYSRVGGLISFVFSVLWGSRTRYTSGRGPTSVFRDLIFVTIIIMLKLWLREYVSNWSSAATPL